MKIMYRIMLPTNWVPKGNIASARLQDMVKITVQSSSMWDWGAKRTIGQQITPMNRHEPNTTSGCQITAHQRSRLSLSLELSMIETKIRWGTVREISHRRESFRMCRSVATKHSSTKVWKPRDGKLEARNPSWLSLRSPHSAQVCSIQGFPRYPRSTHPLAISMKTPLR